MTNAIDTARDDLAFLRAVADDKGPPPIVGLHILSIGLIYGLNLIGIWAGLTFDFALPNNWLAWSWLPGTILYIPICIWLSIRGHGQSLGPTASVFAAAWAAIGLTCLPIVAALVIGQIRTQTPMTVIWPAISFLLYGGAWSALAIVRRKRWHAGVALGCVAVGLTSAWLVDTPAAWLVMGLGLLLFMALPGLALVRMAKVAA